MNARRILLLEDEPSVSTMLAVALRGDGHDVVVCNHFEDARAELRRNVPDAVLTDIRVGQYNGLQLALLFRSLSPEGTIVAVSGHDDPVIRQDVHGLRAHFMVKPIDLSALQALFH
jgi:two-component system response regulator RegA